MTASEAGRMRTQPGEGRGVEWTRLMAGQGEGPEGNLRGLSGSERGKKGSKEQSLGRSVGKDWVGLSVSSWDPSRS